MKPTIETDQYSLYLADCLDVLPTLEGVDAVVTDPPYGVNLGKHSSANEKRAGYLAKQAYSSFDDTPEHYSKEIVPRIVAAISKAERALVFSAGTQMWELPKPDAVSGFFLPAGCGRTKWGFQGMAHFALYGQAQDLHKGATATAWRSTDRAEKSNHPCPKPKSWMLKCVGLAARRENQLILDPFMGSGTTGVAAIELGHRFVGIEIDEDYFSIAAKRIKHAASQRRMFT